MKVYMIRVEKTDISLNIIHYLFEQLDAKQNILAYAVKENSILLFVNSSTLYPHNVLKIHDKEGDCSIKDIIICLMEFYNKYNTYTNS